MYEYYNMTNKKNIFVVLPMLLVIGAFIFVGPISTNTAAFAQGYATGPGPIRIVNVNNEDLHIINETPQVQEPEAEAAPVEEVAEEEGEGEVGHQVDQDLDCVDFTEKNFPVTQDDPYRLDADGDGIGCETQTASNGTEVVVDPTPAEEAVDEEVALIDQLRVEVQSARDVLQLGNTADAVIHIDNALVLLSVIETTTTVEEEEQPAPVAEEEEAPVTPEPEKPTVPVAEEEEEAPVAEEATPTAPVVVEEEIITPHQPTVSGNALFVEQIQLQGIVQDCVDQLIAAGVQLIQAVVVENSDNPEQVEDAIEADANATETAMNETGTTEEVADVIAEVVPEIVTGNATEASEEFVETVTEIGEENAPAIEEEIIS